MLLSETQLKVIELLAEYEIMIEISLIKALSIARDIESGLIEKKFFEVFEGDPIELKHVLLNLVAATREHYNRIEKAWKETR